MKQSHKGCLLVNENETRRSKLIFPKAHFCIGMWECVNLYLMIDFGSEGFFDLTTAITIIMTIIVILIGLQINVLVI